MKHRNCVVYVDYTDTFFSDLNTGIQRVVRNIVSRLDGLNGFQGYHFVPVITIGDKTVKIGDLTQEYPLTQAMINFLGMLRNMVDFCFNFKNKLVPVFLEKSDNSDICRDNASAGGLHWKIVSYCRRIAPLLIRIAYFFDTPFLRNRSVKMQEGDILFLVDSFWSSNALPMVQTAKSKHTQIILLIYDLIPISHPAFCDDINCRKFTELLPEYLKEMDGVIAISEYSMEETIEYCRQSGINSDIAFDYFYLGADFAPDIPSDEPFDQQIVDLGNKKFFLMVGTIEPRKNHTYVLDAFERLWQSGSDLNLCVVGKVGWKCDALVKRMTNSPNFNKNLFVFNDLNDTGLNYLLQKSCAVVIASIVEGFGLPVVEAMHFHKTLLASDIPVFREIGGDYPIYFPLDDHLVLVDLILRVANGNLKSEIGSKGWLTWHESIRMLMEKVINMSGNQKVTGKGNQIETKEINVHKLLADGASRSV